MGTAAKPAAQPPKPANCQLGRPTALTANRTHRTNTHRTNTHPPRHRYDDEELDVITGVIQAKTTTVEEEGEDEEEDDDEPVKAPVVVEDAPEPDPAPAPAPAEDEPEADQEEFVEEEEIM